MKTKNMTMPIAFELLNARQGDKFARFKETLPILFSESSKSKQFFARNFGFYKISVQGIIIAN